MFTFSYLEFVIKIARNHLTTEIVSDIVYSSEGTFVVEPFPMNAYTEIVAKEINPSRGSTPLRVELINSLSEWVEDIREPLARVTNETAFAELCYYCPAPPWA